MWWIVQLLRWYGPEQSRFELQGRIAKEYDISGVEKQMIEQFGADAYGSSVRAKAAMDFARDGTEPKLRKKTLVNDYVYFWLWRWWKPEIESPRFARWRTNATRAIESAKSRKHRLIEEKDSMVWLTEYGTKFGIFHLHYTSYDVVYPKKFFLYLAVLKTFGREMKTRSFDEPFRVLDVGCGTGATVIDLKKIFGRRADVVGVDVLKLQTEIAQQKIVNSGINAEIFLYDGEHLPFTDQSFDAIYTSDVLGHVQDVAAWLKELNRVLRPGGTLAMFSESKLGKHAYVRNYLFKRGLNIDPHAEFHISLYSKTELKEKLTSAGFEVNKMLGVFWASFLVHPDEFYNKLSQTKKFSILRRLNWLLYWLKIKTRPFSLALAELYGLVEAMLIGRWVEAQGYVVISSKSNPPAGGQNPK